ncbi:protein transport protein Sec16B isoform X1 [Pygocentrus nattereri]|uniref:protein transport protein Sec16B isoform X1 n=1 Tax=Pygocentrus nattereri TaxID=42514 RepID=UPI001891E84A|nr:protein transport protein Sec16B isoform X1 [Pygocentrus nattereri]XP_017570445.2 protein transport protein Sec16B isoform X1 [Pygocentrus nattereri]
MESRGHGWYGPGPQYHPSAQPPRHRDRDDYYRPQHPGQGHYPSPDPRERERERQWYSPDPRYRQYLTSPPPRPEFMPGYSSASQSNQSYGPNRARPLSRQAYDYPPQSYWDYRDHYGYYDHGYYRGQYGYPVTSEAGGWPAQDGWRSEVYQGRGAEQEWTGATYPDQQGYGHRRHSVPYDGGVSGMERRKSMENGNGAGETCEPGALASSKTSGLSSSSYELSQYMNGVEQSDAAPPPLSEPEVETKAFAPLKFCVPHVAVSFGPAGQLVRVSPALPSHGEPAQVELHSLEVILSDTREQHDMRDFPGPLAREDLHKVDVINFALQMADACLKDSALSDASTAALLWHLLVLLCRQNGRIVGSDIAELLVRGSQSSRGVCEGDSERSDIGSLIDLSETPSPEMANLNNSDLLTGNPLTEEQTSEQNLQNYTKLLLAGRKKEALESAMRSGLWGHALFLASKMDGRAYTTVLSRFTGSLASSDPLQTLFHLLSGRIPTVATCYSTEKWGDWRPHLAVMLSNETEDSDMHCKSIVCMGDLLASRGLLHAAHICYLTAHSPFGWYTNKAQRLVLLGSSHGVSFPKFCQNSVIRCTEVFEYCQRLGEPSFTIPSFQVYKFLYACRLLDCGLASQAFHYCEVVAKSLLRIQEPHIILLGEVIKLVDRLKHSEAQFSETGADLTWLDLLRRRLQDIQMGSSGHSGAYVSAAEDSAWTHEESREHADFNPDDLSNSEEMIQCFHPDTSHSGAVQEHCEHHESAAQQPHSFVPSEEQSYPSYTSEECSYPPEAQPYAPEEQLPQTYAPVPMYSWQNTLAAPPSQPLGMPGLPPVPAGQDGANQSSYHHTAAGLIPRSHSNTGVEFSTDTNMTPENGTRFGGEDLETEANTKETTSQKSEKSSKSGWFSGWFRSKPRESPQEEITQDKPAHMEPAPAPASPPLMPPIPMASPILASQPQAAGINPFSRRAGQKPGLTSGSMTQGP